jgi:hypothetical protein
MAKRRSNITSEALGLCLERFLFSKPNRSRDKATENVDANADGVISQSLIWDFN